MPGRITPHTFRRTFITLSFQAGKDLLFAQSQAGHANWKTTLDIYTQQSGRSVDVKTRKLLNESLGEPTEEREAEPPAFNGEPFADHWLEKVLA
jgi:integrase-like protein